MDSLVTILMATYNGERYLGEQLESLINQTYTNWTLYIRDDNSSDNTITITKKYSLNDSRIHLLSDGERLGPVGNFSKLLEMAKESDYIMFCDQDDVWKKEKIEQSMQRIKVLEKHLGISYPLLVYTEKKLVDENLKPLTNNLKNSKDDIMTILAQNPIYGCTMLINKALAKLSSPIPPFAQNHDYWIALNASVFGCINKIDDQTIFYRQHNNNATGGINNLTLKGKFLNWKKVNKEMFNAIRQNLIFCNSVQYCNNHFVLEQYVEIFNSNKLMRMIRAFKLGIHRNNLRGTVRLYYVIFKY